MISAPIRNSNVLASNLLFGVLAITWLEFLFTLGLQQWYGLPQPWGFGPIISLLLQTGLSSAIFYNIRHGYLWAKLVLLVMYAAHVFLTTSLSHFLIAGIPVADFYAGKLPLVLKNLLALAALGLMFSKKARQVSRA